MGAGVARSVRREGTAIPAVPSFNTPLRERAFLPVQCAGALSVLRRSPLAAPAARGPALNADAKDAAASSVTVMYS